MQITLHMLWLSHYVVIIAVSPASGGLTWYGASYTNTDTSYAGRWLPQSPIISRINCVDVTSYIEWTYMKQLIWLTSERNQINPLGDLLVRHQWQLTNDSHNIMERWETTNGLWSQFTLLFEAELKHLQHGITVPLSVIFRNLLRTVKPQIYIFPPW